LTQRSNANKVPHTAAAARAGAISPSRPALLLSLTRDAQAINAVVNHPGVRPFVGLPEMGELDLTPLVEREEHLFPFGEHGGFMLAWTAPATREVHTFILPEGRGRWACDAAAEMIALAGEQGTVTLWTQIAPDQRNVVAYAKRAGMRETGEVLNTFGKRHLVYSMGVGSCQ
jgi:hypothetical protein